MASRSLTELKIDGWRSGYSSVNNVLRHLQRKSSGYGFGSYSSVTGYAEILSWLVRFSGGKNPDELVSLPREEIEELIHSYLDSLIVKGLSKNTVKMRRSYLLLHFSKNGFKRERELEIETYHVPARYRKAPEYIPNSGEVLRMADAALSPRDRAMILCLYTSGLRHKTLLALRYKDVKHDLKNDIVLVPVYPEMKKVVPNACKNNIPYYTFFDPLSTEALRAYLRGREDGFGPIGDEETLFHPDPQRAGIKRDVARFKPLNKNELKDHILKRAARSAGIEEWKGVHPHCLRKSFEEAVRTRRPDGSMMGEKDQQFILGHILPGSEDPYYGGGVRVQGSTVNFDREVAYKLREEYRMIRFFPERSMMSKDEVLSAFNRRFLKLSGWTDAEIDALGDLSELEESKMRELLDRKRKQSLGLNGNTQKVVPMGEVKRFIEEGWEYLSTLPSGEAVIRLPPR